MESKQDRPTKKHLRIHKINYPKFQVVLLLVNALCIGGGMIAIALQSHYTLLYIRQFALEGGIRPDHYLFEILDVERLKLIDYHIVIGCICLLISTIVTIILTHRLAGPFIRLKIFFKSLIETPQERNRVFFRKNDFMQELPPLINEALDKIQDDKEN